MARIDSFFKLMAEQKASDLHLSTSNPPMLRINGDLVRVDFPALENDDLKAMVYEIAPEGKIKVKIPKGTQIGDMIKVSGKGFGAGGLGRESHVALRPV